MTKILPIEPRQFVTRSGIKVRHIYKCEEIVLCDFDAIAFLLNCTPEKAVQVARERDLISVFDNYLYCTTDDFVLLVREFLESPLPVKELAKKIHEKSESELMIYHFMFNQLFHGWLK